MQMSQDARQTLVKVMKSQIYNLDRTAFSDSQAREHRCSSKMAPTLKLKSSFQSSRREPFHDA
jgi:hypothetical protein